MNCDDVQKILDGAGVSRALYAFRYGDVYDGLVVEKKMGEWVVYYHERGVIYDEPLHFATEGEACIAFMIRMLLSLKNMPNWG